jgi:hypothetical protein
MSDELERRLREAGHRLPGPTDSETRSARARVLAARPHGGRRGLVLALAAVLVAAGAFGVGYAVAGGKTVTKTVVLKPRLEAGPGFLPAPGWTVTNSEREATATSASGIRIVARFAPASEHRHLLPRLLPLRLPRGGSVRLLRVHVGAYAVEVTVTFASPPGRAELAAAREELGRLAVPSCPAARPLAGRDVAAAKAFVLGWLPAHYDGAPRGVAGATAVAHLGTAMPRHGEAVADCGRAVAARSVEIDVTLPRVAKVSASLSQLTYFVARTAQGWTVWERAR